MNTSAIISEQQHEMHEEVHQSTLTFFMIIYCGESLIVSEGHDLSIFYLYTIDVANGRGHIYNEL
jgi:hypothetical protein